MPRHPKPLIALHWLTAAAVLLAFVTGGNPAKAKDALDLLAGQAHVASGLLVFALVALRLPLRAVLGAQASVPGPRWQQRAATAAHVGLYALMLVVPLAGWAALADKTTAFTLLGLALPLPDANAAWVRLLGDAHSTLGDAFIWLAGLHAAAALAHHFVLRDATLMRMLPRRG
jgi:cytochrome b561